MIIIENFIVKTFSSLLESKKEAMRILGEWADLPIMDDSLNLFQAINGLDPTPSKKYVNTFAVIVKNYINNRLEQRDIQSYLDPDSSNLPQSERDELVKNAVAKSVKEYLLLDEFKSIPETILMAEEKGFKEDISKFKDIGSLYRALKKDRFKITRSSIKKGIKGIVEDVDYAVVYENEKVIGYMPFSWEASKVLASKYAGECEGDWCLAYQKTREHWDTIVQKDKNIPVYMILKDESVKYAFLFENELQGKGNLRIWDHTDQEIVEEDKKELLKKLNIFKDELQEIREDIWSLAIGNIIGFNIRNQYSEIKIELEFENNGFVATGFYNDVIEYLDEDVDYDTIDIFITRANILSQKDLLKNEITQKLFKYLKENINLKSTPDILSHSMGLFYVNDNPTYTSIFNEMMRLDYKDSHFNYDTNIFKKYLEKNKIQNIYIISKQDSDDEENPLVASLNDIHQKKPISFTFDIEPGLSITIYSISEYKLLDVIENYPHLNTIVKDEWYPDDEREKQYGQQFLNYEKRQLTKNKNRL